MYRIFVRNDGTVSFIEESVRIVTVLIVPSCASICNVLIVFALIELSIVVNSLKLICPVEIVFTVMELKFIRFILNTAVEILPVVNEFVDRFVIAAREVESEFAVVNWRIACAPLRIAVDRNPVLINPLKDALSAYKICVLKKLVSTEGATNVSATVENNNNLSVLIVLAFKVRLIVIVLVFILAGMIEVGRVNRLKKIVSA